MDEYKIIDAINTLRGIGSNTEACELAIDALEKKIPNIVKIEDWKPSICPSCGHELSESLGDGYYKHYTHLEICPKCTQRLKWE